MTEPRLVLVCDQYLLDSELLAAALPGDVLAEAARPHALPSMDLSSIDLVLLNMAADDEHFRAAVGRARSVGLLWHPAQPYLGTRVRHPKVQLVLDRSIGLDEVARRVQQALGGRPTKMGRPDRSRESAPSLSPREHQVLQLIAQGLGNRDIAAQLSISPHTVRTHVQAVLTKLDRGTRFSAVGAARQAGLLPL